MPTLRRQPRSSICFPSSVLFFNLFSPFPLPSLPLSLLSPSHPLYPHISLSFYREYYPQFLNSSVNNH